MSIEAINRRFAELAGYPCKTALFDYGLILEVMCEHRDRYFVVGINRKEAGDVAADDVEDLAQRAVEAMRAIIANYDRANPK